MGTVDKDKIIYGLWKLLDNIEMLSELPVNNDSLFRGLVEHTHQKRYSVAGYMNRNALISLISELDGKYKNGGSRFAN